MHALRRELDAQRKLVQAQHPGLTLTGMYNVLEKLRQQSGPHFAERAEGNPLCGQGAFDSSETAQGTVRTTLTGKERLIHDQGLVSLLNNCTTISTPLSSPPTAGPRASPTPRSSTDSWP